MAPNMTDLNASGGGRRLFKRPKGNIDPTGEYFLWASNMGGNRADVFIARIPAHLLGMTGSSAPARTRRRRPLRHRHRRLLNPHGRLRRRHRDRSGAVGVHRERFRDRHQPGEAGGCDGCPDASAVSSGRSPATA